MTPSKLKQARINAGLTQEEAAALVYISSSNWRKWESTAPVGKSEKNNFKRCCELFMYKTGQVK